MGHISLGLVRVLKNYQNLIEMSSDFNFAVASWFLRNVHVKPISTHSAGVPQASADQLCTPNLIQFFFFHSIGYLKINQNLNQSEPIWSKLIWFDPSWTIVNSPILLLHNKNLAYWFIILEPTLSVPKSYHSHF